MLVRCVSTLNDRATHPNVESWNQKTKWVRSCQLSGRYQRWTLLMASSSFCQREFTTRCAV